MACRIGAACALSLLACSTSAPSGSAGEGTPGDVEPVRDPSFEGAQPNPQGQAKGSPWNLATSCAGRFGPVWPSFATGTSFMPTDGTQYARFDDRACVEGERALAIDQYNDELSTETTVTFDWEVVPTASDICKGWSATVELLFTGNGTQTLWSSGAVTAPVQRRDERIALPSLPAVPQACVGACNKLTLRVRSSGGCVPAPSETGLDVCPCATFDVGVDHVRVD